MPPAYVVRAQVIDVNSDAPQATDRFAVDTNVWAYEHYKGAQYTASGGLVAQAADYSRYLERTRNAGAARFRIVPSQAELASVIEHLEHAAYVAAVARVDPKEYRHNLPSERARVCQVIERAWRDVEGDSDLIALTLDDAFAAAALAELTAFPLDGSDAFLLRAMRATGVTQLISDDGDFCTVAGIELFTANPRVLAAARAQGRLASR
jgi:predicted nucleic acid-binding protein